MDWIDDTVAVGGWLDAFCAQRRRREGVELLVDARLLFEKSLFMSKRIPLVNELLRSRDLLVDCLPQTPKVLIFCNQGRDRSPFVAMLYLSKRYEISFQEAYGLVRSKHQKTVFHWDWVRAIEKAEPNR